MFENINLWGRQTPQIIIESFNDEYSCCDVTISNLCHNGKRLKDDGYKLVTDSYSKNIVIK